MLAKTIGVRDRIFDVPVEAVEEIFAELLRGLFQNYVDTIFIELCEPVIDELGGEYGLASTCRSREKIDAIAD